MLSATTYWDYQQLRDLGGYVGSGLEVTTTASPLRALALFGWCDEPSWDQFEAAYAVSQHDVVDISALGFLAPAVRGRFALWVLSTGAVVVNGSDNPDIDTVNAVDSWVIAGERLTRRPVLRVIGYWASNTDPSLPNPATLAVNDDDANAHRIADVLDQGVPYLYAMGLSPCRICGKPNGSAELTNGTYAWPEGLSHYVREHRIALPPDLSVNALSLPTRSDRWLTAVATEACERTVDWWRQVSKPAGSDPA